MKKILANIKLISFILTFIAVFGSISAFAWEYNYTGPGPLTVFMWMTNI